MCNWIRVEDELPKYGVDVFIHSKHLGVVRGELLSNFSVENGPGEWVRPDTEYLDSVNDVTHWAIITPPIEEE